MTCHKDKSKVRLYHGDCLEVLPTLPEASFTACVTDPPYGLEFMGNGWDRGVPGVDYWREVLRVLKPGAMVLAFGGTRTFHRLTAAIEDAGFEIRDCLMWLYGSGFPKSMDISKAIDKAAGATREVIGVDPVRAAKLVNQTGQYETEAGWSAGNRSADITAPATDAAKLWSGYGTALKPAYEPIILAMKPLDGTYAANALEHGVAGLNVDKCRIATTNNLNGGAYAKNPKDRDQLWGDDPGNSWRRGGAGEYKQPEGRWPANVILDEAAGEILDRQTGVLTSGKGAVRKATGKGHQGNAYGKESRAAGTPCVEYGDPGGASRFFYCAKASKKDRTNNGTVENKHPTVKPRALMEYLCRLVTPPGGGRIIDPFMGSGSTGLGALAAGNEFVGIELEKESYLTAKARLA